MPLFRVWSEDKLNKKFVMVENLAELVSAVCFNMPGGRQHSGEFDQNFSKKSNARGFAPGGGAWAVLELTGTLAKHLRASTLNLVYTVSDTLKRWITRLPKTN